MKLKFTLFPTSKFGKLLAVCILAVWSISPLDSINTAINIVEWSEWTPEIGGCGGVFFMAPAGPLEIEVAIRDLKTNGNPSAVRVILASPDRTVLADEWIKKDESNSNENTNQHQILKLETDASIPGLYAVMITASNDRYGENFTWKFRTNCKKYMIETSRGHRDAFHEEPIVLKDPQIETSLCFLPQRNAFNILISDMHEDVKSVELVDAEGHSIAVLDVKNDSAIYNVDAGIRNATPWALRFDKAQGKVEIEGVTRWDGDDRSSAFHQFPDGSIWTPDINSWFDLHQNRWLLSPYKKVIYGLHGEKSTAVFEIHNNDLNEEKVDLNLEFPGKPWNVQLSDKELTLAPGEEKQISLSWTSSDTTQTVHLRARIGNFTTYSTLISKNGISPVNSPIPMPLVLEPYSHEQEQFGYIPDYPLENQLYFNTYNKPFVRTTDEVWTIRDEKWLSTSTSPMANSIVAFDSDGGIYTLGKMNDHTVLMYSNDGGASFTSYVIPGDTPESIYDIEQFTGHNYSDGPPPITRVIRNAKDKNLFWRRYGDIELLIPKKTKNGIEWEEPILISDKCLGVSSHSGIPSSMVSKGSKIFLCWGEASDPKAGKEEIPGVPVYVTAYDKVTQKLEKPVLVGFGAPANDIHNIPSIIIDGNGYLHVLTGTHGRPFHYSRSITPESTTGGWSKAKPIMVSDGSKSSQTYIGLVVDHENTLHLVFRLWRFNTKNFPDGYYASLSYMSKKEGEAWSEPRILVVAPFSDYSIYRHRLTVDRNGRIFLSYYYWSTYWFYRNDRKGIQRSVLMSPDGGTSWKLASNEEID